MPSIDNTTILIAVGGIVILVALLMMGNRLRRFIFKAGGIDATADAGTAGSKIVGNKVDGDFNKASTEGENSLIKNNKLRGSGNEFSAKSGGGV